MRSAMSWRPEAGGRNRSAARAVRAWTCLVDSVQPSRDPVPTDTVLVHQLQAEIRNERQLSSATAIAAPPGRRKSRERLSREDCRDVHYAPLGLRADRLGGVAEHLGFGGERFVGQIGCPALPRNASSRLSDFPILTPELSETTNPRWQPIPDILRARLHAASTLSLNCIRFAHPPGGPHELLLDHADESEPMARDYPCLGPIGVFQFR